MGMVAIASSVTMSGLGSFAEPPQSLSATQEKCVVTTPILTAERLRELLHYDPDTGIFTRRGFTHHPVGRLNGMGYLTIYIDGRTYLAHRLVWLYLHGEFPGLQIDHKNGAKADNRVDNLRTATPLQNQQNHRRARKDNRSGLLGAHWRADVRKYQAKIQVNGVTVHLGYFPTPEEAHAAYVEAKRRLHPASTL